MPTPRRLVPLTAMLIATWVAADASPRAKAPSRIHQQPVQQQQQHEEQEQQGTLNETVGMIHWSDPDRGLAVVQLHRTTNRFDSRLITRDFDLNPTAVVQPTAIQRNRMIGVIVVSGTVAAGDEVIIPGIAYRKAFGDLLKSE